VTVLQDAYNDLGIFPEFIAALGVMGIDGSVEDRMNGNRHAQKIRAKTGTLNHVSALSGYFQSMDGERFAFSILLNDLKCSNGKAMKLEDDILDLALHFKRCEVGREEESAEPGPLSINP
jgi:D-alanyl-D-alanine carboxypeptidase/D-alanyl-D-alanine-endopeptidase (penicillin-binding protein 4)